MQTPLQPNTQASAIRAGSRASQRPSLRLALGTVDFATRTGKHALSISPEEIAHVLQRAKVAGIDLLDTDPRAGDSQTVLAHVLSRHAEPAVQFQVMARTPAFFTGPITNLHGDQLLASVQTSLNNLQQDALYAVMLASDEGLLLPGGELLYHRLDTLKSQGKIWKIGVCVQGSADLNRVFALVQPDIIQLPLNVLDQRLLHSGHLAELKRRGVEIHVRSIFHQGVLLDPTHLHPWFWPIKPTLERYHACLIEAGLTPLEGALSFAAGIPEIDRVLVGADMEDRLIEILDALGSLDAGLDFSVFACPEPKMVDPRQWNLYE